MIRLSTASEIFRSDPPRGLKRFGRDKVLIAGSKNIFQLSLNDFSIEVVKKVGLDAHDFFTVDGVVYYNELTEKRAVSVFENLTLPFRYNHNASYIHTARSQYDYTTMSLWEGDTHPFTHDYVIVNGEKQDHPLGKHWSRPHHVAHSSDGAVWVCNSLEGEIVDLTRKKAFGLVGDGFIQGLEFDEWGYGSVIRSDHLQDASFEAEMFTFTEQGKLLNRQPLGVEGYVYGFLYV